MSNQSTNSGGEKVTIGTNPISFVQLQKTGESLGWASPALEPEDKENRVPAPAPVGKRRREQASDSILQERNGKGKQRRTSAEGGKASAEALVSEPPFHDDEEFGANLATELEVEGDEEFRANVAAELKAEGDDLDAIVAEIEADDIGDEEGIPSPDAIQDDVGDEEYVPSPDGIEDDFFVKVETDEDDFFVKVETEPELIDPSMGANSDFVALLRDLISELVQWAKAHNVLEMDSEHRPMTLGYWSLLGRLSVDFAVSLFLPGIPEEVQALFRKGKKEWSREDFLSLPSAKDDGRQGIYANFATGDLRREDEEFDVYVGSARHLKKRIGCHLAMAEKHSVTNLPEQYKRSFHYRQICRNGVQSNFRRLAAFDRPIEPGYLLLLEGIFMILFKTYQYPGYCCQYATMSSYKLTEEIMNLLDIPSVPWRGMNAAWPLRQGFLRVQKGRQRVNAYVEILEILWDRISVVVVMLSNDAGVYFRTKKFLKGQIS
ncbi:hypothetical protein CDV55_103654 [Aspergillus turcosus]|uniref:Uncharacterized protein n=1 Tax=Aspergillus turcosus TaxID=1245748 RepID=A0A229YIT6_9EURO|nr:hypothetical protein CDV55_103654 [Aspergillus turcosus]RLL99665.1 hypothetical protein CFD26_107562 [Aspergillus turcosus]